MSYAFEIRYAKPADAEKEKRIESIAHRFGGAVTYRHEDPDPADSSAESVGFCIELTCEFADLATAEQAADAMRREIREFVEGPFNYGD